MQVDEAEEGKRALQFLQMNGYRKCDIAACNCPYWHGGKAEERLRDIHDVLQEAGLRPHEKTAIAVIRELVATKPMRESGCLDEEYLVVALYKPFARKWNKQAPEVVRELLKRFEIRRRG